MDCKAGSSAAAKLHDDLVRAVPSARFFAHPIGIGSFPIAVEVIGVETTLVRHGDNQHAVEIDVDVPEISSSSRRGPPFLGRALCNHARAV